MIGILSSSRTQTSSGEPFIGWLTTTPMRQTVSKTSLWPRWSEAEKSRYVTGPPCFARSQRTRHSTDYGATYVGGLNRPHLPSGMQSWRTTPSPAACVERRERVAELRNALGRLPHDQARVLCLRFLEGQSYRQTAKQLDITVNAVGVLLNRAKARLRKELDPPSAQNPERSDHHVSTG